MRGPAPPGNTAKGTPNPMSVAGPNASARGSGPVVKGSGRAGSGTPRGRETVANDPHQAGVNREVIARRGPGGRLTQGEKTAGTQVRIATAPTSGGPRADAKRRSGMVQRLAASDDATRPTNAEGKQTSREVMYGSICRALGTDKGKRATVQSIRTDDRDRWPTMKGSAAR